MENKGNYWSSTPKKYRAIGDSILLGTTMLSTLMMAAPFSAETIAVTVWALSVIGVVGKVITNFFKEEN